MAGLVAAPPAVEKGGVLTMHPEAANPATGFESVAGLGVLSSAAQVPNPTTTPIIINRLCRRYALSAPVAALIVSHAGLGPREYR